MRRRASRGSGSATVPQQPLRQTDPDKLTEESEDVSRPRDQDLIAVADAILEKNPWNKDDHRTSISRFVGPLFRVVVTFLVFQPVFWGMASQTNDPESSAKEGRKPEL